MRATQNTLMYLKHGQGTPLSKAIGTKRTGKWSAYLKQNSIDTKNIKRKVKKECTFDLDAMKNGMYASMIAGQLPHGFHSKRLEAYYASARTLFRKIVLFVKNNSKYSKLLIILYLLGWYD